MSVDDILIPQAVSSDFQLTFPAMGLSYDLDDEIVIGNDASCDVTITSEQLHDRHARITLNDDGMFLEDLNTANATRLNGSLIGSGAWITLGDEVELEGVSFVIESRVKRAAAAYDHDHTGPNFLNALDIPGVPIGSATPVNAATPDNPATLNTDQHHAFEEQAPITIEPNAFEERPALVSEEYDAGIEEYKTGTEEHGVAVDVHENVNTEAELDTVKPDAIEQRNKPGKQPLSNQDVVEATRALEERVRARLQGFSAADTDSTEFSAHDDATVLIPRPGGTIVSDDAQSPSDDESQAGGNTASFDADDVTRKIDDIAKKASNEAKQTATSVAIPSVTAPPATTPSATAPAPAKSNDTEKTKGDNQSDPKTAPILPEISPFESALKAISAAHNKANKKNSREKIGEELGDDLLEGFDIGSFSEKSAEFESLDFLDTPTPPKATPEPVATSTTTSSSTSSTASSTASMPATAQSTASNPLEGSMLFAPENSLDDLESGALTDEINQLNTAPRVATYPRFITVTDDGLEIILAVTNPATQAAWTLGSGSDCDIQLNETEIDRHHATLHKQPNGYQLKANKITSGMVVNGLFKNEIVLKHGDRVQFGITEFLFEQSNGAVSNNEADSLEGKRTIDYGSWVGAAVVASVLVAAYFVAPL